ncbi:hypothetical protein [Streptomyces sp. BPSDS2]|uniref:DUF6907 domain-containing protein n=1 Tax=Streptomyces sp. BPSDS2 TaxID=2571021 RepID=UPI0010C24072|nr:hypothetical protein [Streptomyces sp. BPSDS2]
MTTLPNATDTRQLNLGQPEPAAAECTVYPWCAETGDHTLHVSAYTEAPTLDGFGDCVLPANVMAEDVPEGLDISVGWLDLNLTAAQTRARVAELHRHLDTVAALADIVDGQAPLDPGAETYSVTAAGASGAIISSEIYRLDDPKRGEPAARIAVFGQPGADADLDVAGADQLTAELEKFLPRLRAQRNHLAALTSNEGGTSPVPPRTLGGSIRATDGKGIHSVETPERHSMPVILAAETVVIPDGNTVSPADGTPGHYPWCNTTACITHRYDEHEGGGTYFEHVGHETALTVADGGYAEDAITFAVGLGSDESFDSAPELYLNVAKLNGLAFNPAGVDKLIGQLDTLTSALRTMRGQMDSEVRP